MSLALLAGQVVLAVVALRLLRRRVLPVIEFLPHPAVIVDVWVPLVVVAPLIVLAGRIDGAVAVTGWPAIGGPVAAGWIALAAVMIASPGDRGGPMRRWPLVAAGFAGVFALLLSAAHVMTVFVGQCALAAAAVLLWIATPAVEDEGPPAPVESRAGLALLASLLCAAGMGGLALAVEPSLQPVAVGLVMGYVAMTACSLGIAGTDVARRVAAWSAAYGVLLALGVAALRTMVPAALQILGGQRGTAPDGVAYGFGLLAPEACALLVLGPAIWGAERIPGRSRRAFGVALLLVVAMVVGWRVATSAGS